MLKNKVKKHGNCKSRREMLTTCTKDDFFKYSDFAYELASDLTKSSYPTYCDGLL